MQETAFPFAKVGSGVPVAMIERHAQGWFIDSEYRQLSPATIAGRTLVMEKLLWFLHQNELIECGPVELRRFLVYVGNSEGGGVRWGNSHLRHKTRPSTPATYYARLRTFFRFLVSEGAIESSPIENLRPPVSRSDQVRPFTEQQIESLMAVARRTVHPKRDVAILSLLFDTGMRAGELCSLKIGDVDLTSGRCTVLAKGNRYRSVYFGRDTKKALFNYLLNEKRQPDEPLFISDRGVRARESITESGLLQLMHRIGDAARIESCRCSPHTCRHTFAVMFLRNGGNVFTLKELLGHSSLTMVNRYVQLAQADLEAQHRLYSPLDRLRARR